MKNTLILIILFVSICPNFALANPKFKIGVSIPLSGEASTWGTDMLNSINLAKDEFLKDDFELIFEDDKCDPKTAVSIANKFVNVDKVDAVLGYTCSGPLIAAANIYEKAKIPVISTSASAAKISEAGEYIYRTFPSDALAGELLFDHISKTNKKLGVLSTETEYCQGFVEQIKTLNSKNKIDIVFEKVKAEDHDVKPILLRLKNKNVDSLFINSQSDREFLRTLKQVRQMKMDIPLYSAYWGSSSWFLSQAGDLAENLVTVDAASGERILNEEGKRVLALFQEKYGEPNFSKLLIAINWEGVRAISEALKHPPGAKKFLDQTTFKGIVGDWSFDHNGDIKGLSFSLKRSSAGSATEIE
jgi:branched-chain amino acid transport system substrate-binding protein